MNKEEVKFDHFKDIEELIKHLEMWYAEDDYFAYERYFHLRDARIMGMFIYELQQENKQLKEELQKADSITQSCIFEGKEESAINFRECLNKLDLYKEVIEEVREVAQELKLHYQQHPTMIPSVKLNKLLQILDKVKEVK